MSNVLSLAPLFRQSVGFDRFNDLFESALRSNDAGSSYPPYNVEKHGEDHYRIVVAAAGFEEDDLELQVERDVLTVVGNKRDRSAENISYLIRASPSARSSCPSAWLTISRSRAPIWSMVCCMSSWNALCRKRPRPSVFLSVASVLRWKTEPLADREGAPWGAFFVVRQAWRVAP